MDMLPRTPDPVPDEPLDPAKLLDALNVVLAFGRPARLTVAQVSRNQARGILRTTGWTDRLTGRELAGVLRQFPVTAAAAGESVQGGPTSVDSQHAAGALDVDQVGADTVAALAAVTAKLDRLEQARAVYDRMRDRPAGHYLTSPDRAYALIAEDLLDQLGAILYPDGAPAEPVSTQVRDRGDDPETWR